MKEVNFKYRINDSLETVYDRICDFKSYELFAEAVKSLSLSKEDANSVETSWEVNFRGGILKWVEKDIFDRANHKIKFHQIKGDLDRFDGSWSAEKADSTITLLTFNAFLDLGVPQLESMLEPIAVKALHENISSIVKGLFGGRFRGEGELNSLEPTNEYA